MLTDKKRNNLYWFFKIGGVVISCLLPIWAVCEKYPLWKTAYSTGRSLGVGSILILIVVTIVFRKSVFGFLTDRLKLKNAPPLTVWIIMLILSYVLIYIGAFLEDLTIVLWMGFLGCAIGTLLTFIGENYFGKKEDGDG